MYVYSLVFVRTSDMRARVFTHGLEDNLHMCLCALVCACVCVCVAVSVCVFLAETLTEMDETESALQGIGVLLRQ